MRHQIIFLEQDYKTKLVPTSFTCFLGFLWKNKLQIINSFLILLRLISNITVISSLYCNKTNEILLFTLLSQKTVRILS